MITIRPAAAADVASIFDLATSLSLHGATPADASLGFLTSAYSERDYAAFQAAASAYRDYRQGRTVGDPWKVEPQRKPVWFDVAADEAGAIIGFLIAFGRNYAAPGDSERPAVDIASRRIGDLLGTIVPFAIVKQVAVAPTSRRQGIARRLYGHAFAQMMDHEPHLNSVFASVVLEPANPPSEALHAALGFLPAFQTRSEPAAAEAAFPVQVWHRPLRPEITVFRGEAPVAADVSHLIEARASAERLYTHEDNLNWKKLSILGVLLFTQVAALWTILNAMVPGGSSPAASHQPQLAFLLVTLLAVGALGILAVSYTVLTLESGRYFMAVHKATAKTLEAQIRAMSPSFFPPISAVPTTSRTSKVLRTLPRQALLVSLSASLVSFLLGAALLILRH